MSTIFLPVLAEKERKLIALRAAAESGEFLEPLSDNFQRTKESSIGAVRDITQGAFRTVFKSGERLRGLGQVAQGLVDIPDVLTSPFADGGRIVTNHVNRGGHTPSRFHTVRALKQFKDIRTVPQAVSSVVDFGHALFFKSGSDVLKLIRSARSG